MKKPSYSVDILQIVIARCCFEELITVTAAIKEELELYQTNEIKDLFSFLQKRYGQLIYSHNIKSRAYYCESQAMVA
jgi:hypothetical protein